MIKHSEGLRDLEDNYSKKEGIVPYSQAIKIFESLWNEGVQLGVLPPKDPMEVIEVDIRIARILNSCSKNFSPE